MRERCRHRRSDRSYRTFLCAECEAPARICRSCDRAQRYCSGRCARTGRLRQLREAGRRYQASSRGRALNAERQRQWRARQASGQAAGPL